MARNGVGVVGLGDMGGAIAAALGAAGLGLVVHDVRPAAVARVRAEVAGAVDGGSVAGVAARADVVLVVVLDDAQVEAVVDELAEAARPGTTVVVQSTVRPATVRDAAARLAPRDVAVVDAAVSGGAEKARRGDLSVLVGGGDEAVARIRPVLDAIGAHVHHVGPVGAGVAVKVVNNLLSLGTYALQLEAMRLAAAHGIDEDVVTTAVASSQGDSRGLRTWGRMDRIRAERRAGAPAPVVYAQIAKDLRTAAAVAGAEGLDLPLTAAAASILPDALRRRDEDLAARAAPIGGPRCARCDQELAAPFRGAGVHPECV